jgi:hypothetical protein
MYGTMKPHHSTLLPILLALASLAAAADPSNGLTSLYAFTDPLPAGVPKLVTRFDQTIDFSYAPGEPPIATYPSTDYSVTWSGAISAPQTGTYTFYMTVDDDARLRIGDAWVLDRLAYSGGSATVVQGTAALVAGQHTPFLLRYWQGPGTAVAKLEWSGPGVARAVVPASALFPTGWTHIEAPATSYSSPVSAIIYHGVLDVPAVSAGGGGSLVGSLVIAGGTTAIAELTLHPQTAATITVASGGETQTRSVAWTPIDLADPPASAVLVRAGDHVLVQARPGHIPTIALDYGTPTALPATTGGFYIATPAAGGHYTISDGAGGPGAAVTAYAVTLASSSLGGTIEVNSEEFVQAPFPVIPADALAQIQSGTFEENMLVGNDPTLAATADIQVFTSGTTEKAYLRIGSSGPILGVANVCGYALSSGPANIDTVNAGGSQSGLAEILIYPYFKNLEYTFAMRVHKATFLSGATGFTVKTDGSAPSIGGTGFSATTVSDGRVCGKLVVRVLFPAGESKWCFTAEAQQIGQ